MPADINNVHISGELIRDVQVRCTPTGLAVMAFKLMMRCVSGVRQKEKEVENFIDIVAYGEVAEKCRDHMKRGERLLIEGRLQSRSFTTADGEKKDVLEVIAQKITRYQDL